MTMTKEDYLRHLQEMLTQQLMPGNVKGPAEDLVTGRVKLLEQKDSFQYSCTMCGGCCRTFDKTLLITAYDLWLMSRSPRMSAMGIRTTGALFSAFPDAFSFGLGGMTRVPVGRLTAPEGALGLPACRFAYPQVKRPDGRVLTLEEGRAFAKTHGIDALKSETEVVINSQGMPALGCSLGLEHQPTLCRAFPVGRAKLEGLGDADMKTVFYFVENGACEGLGGPESQTVGEWIDRKGLRDRWDQSDWFVNLVTSVARLRMHKRIPLPVLEILYTLLQKLWYDFDSVRWAPTGGWPTWEEVRADMERSTQAAVEGFEELAKAMHGPQGVTGGVHAMERYLRRIAGQDQNQDHDGIKKAA